MTKSHLFFILSFCFLMISCKDDDPAVRSNQATYDGESYDLTKGYLITYGENSDGSFDWDVILVGGTVDISSAGQATGNGPLLYMDLNSDSETGLVSGTYTYDDGPRAAFIMVDGQFNANADASDPDAGTIEVNGGTVEVTVGTNHTFDFNFTVDGGGSNVTGFYDGALISI